MVSTVKLQTESCLNRKDFFIGSSLYFHLSISQNKNFSKETIASVYQALSLQLLFSTPCRCQNLCILYMKQCRAHTEPMYIFTHTKLSLDFHTLNCPLMKFSKTLMRCVFYMNSAIQGIIVTRFSMQILFFQICSHTIADVEPAVQGSSWVNQDCFL